MEFLADENVPGPIIRRLRENGFVVRAIAETQAGGSDPIVLDEAGQAGFLLITQDNDFGELVILRETPVAGVVLLELARLSLSAQVERVARCFANEADKFTGHFTVIEPSRTRRRALGSPERRAEL